jgi:hypothetical protein
MTSSLLQELPVPGREGATWPCHNLTLHSLLMLTS